MIIKNGKTISSIYKGNKVIEKIYKGTLVVYESFKNLLASGVPPLTLLNCKGVDLVDYKIFGNSKQEGTPTPETPIEIESVGDKTKNLLDASAIVPVQIASNRTRYGFDLGVLPAGDYIFHFELGEGGTFPEYFYFYYKGHEDEYAVSDSNYHITTTTVRRNPMKFTADGVTNYYLICASSEHGTLELTTAEIEKAKNYMLETGTERHEYEQFGYKIPIISRGKNIFDMTSLLANSNFSKNENGDYVTTKFTNSFSLNNELVKKVASALKPNTQYTISREAYGIDGNASAEGQIRIMASGEVLSRIPNANGLTSNTFTFTQEQIDSITHIYVYGNNSGNPVTFRTIQIEEGDLTDYEPYIEPITTNIYLNEPLRKVGNYADYIDFVNEKVVRTTKYKKIDSDNITRKSTSSTENFNYYFLSLDNDNMIGRDIPILSNIGGGIYTEFVLKNKEGIFTNTNTTYFIAFFNITTLEEAQQFVLDNNVYANYILTTPIEEPIELSSIPTHKGTTILEVDTKVQPSNLEVVYKGK